MLPNFSRFSVMLAALLCAGYALAQPAAKKEYEPSVGQSGKDVVWVPTPAILVEHMLDVAKVTPQDFVMDLGPAQAHGGG